MRNGTCTRTFAVASVSPVGLSEEADANVLSILSRPDLPSNLLAASSASISMSSAGSSISSAPGLAPFEHDAVAGAAAASSTLGPVAA
eukprot:scaffold63587_cov28-Tisochrysis_lutea.AAC.2